MHVVRSSRPPALQACVTHSAKGDFTCSGSVDISADVCIGCSTNTQISVTDIFHVVTDTIWIWSSALISASLLDCSL